MGFTETQATWTLVFGLVSLICSSLILVSAIVMRKALPIVLKCVVCMAACDFFYVLKFVVHACIHLNESATARMSFFNSDYCVFLAWAGQFSGLATISWSFIIALDVYFNLVNPFRHRTSNHFWRYSAYVWGLSIAVSILLLACNQYGEGIDGSCAIRTDNGIWPAVGGFYIWIVLYIFFTLFVVFKYWRHTQRGTAMKPTDRAILKRLVRFLFVFVAAWGVQLITNFDLHQIQGFATKTRTTVAVVNSVANASVGMLNCFLWWNSFGLTTLLNPGRYSPSRPLSQALDTAYSGLIELSCLPSPNSRDRFSGEGGDGRERQEWQPIRLGNTVTETVSGEGEDGEEASIHSNTDEL